MTYVLAMLLGTVQGLTEFLPVSSSGHLVLLQKIFGISEPPIFFDTMLHLGTLLVVVVFFGKRAIGEIRESGVIRRVMIGTVPIVGMGLLVQPFVKEIFGSLLVVGVGYFITAGLLFWTKSLATGQKKFTELTLRQTLLIGGFQAVALVPGISRSGVTIVGGLSQKLDRESAFKFSFYLSIPAIVGANLLQLKGLSGVDFLPQSFLGMVMAFITGYFALNLLQKVLRAGKLYYFSAHCLLLGLVSLGLTFLKL